MKNILKKVLFAVLLGLMTTSFVGAATVLFPYQGGTGVSSFTPYALITGGTTSGNPLQTVSGLGTANQLLFSNGAGALPSWQSVSNLESTLEGFLDLQDLQGAVTDGQVPNTITIDLATLASTITVVDSTDATSFVGIYDSATGSLAPKTDGALLYDASNGTLTTTTFTGALSGNATTATALANNPTDCSSNQFANAIAANGNLTCAAIADADVPNTITIDLATLATTVTVSDAGGDTTTFPMLAIDATGSLGPRTDAGLSYQATTNALTATTFIGALTGNSSTATALAADPADCSSDQFANAINASGTLTCAALTLAGSQFANQGTTTTVLHGNASGNPSWGGVVTGDITNGTIGYVDVDNTQTLAGNPANGNSSVWFATTGLIFEGATSDTFEGLLVSADITTPDKTWTLPNTTGTLITTGDSQTVTSTMITDATIVTGDISGSAGITAAQTAITAGRSLTWATNDISADAELYTDTKCYRIENPVATDDDKSIWFAKQAATITSIWAESDQTTTFMLQVDDGSPADVDSVDLAPAAGTAEDTSLNGDTTMAAGDRLDVDLVSVSGTPTWVTMCWTFTYDD